MSIRATGNVRGISLQLWDSLFLRACRGEPTHRTPVWLMRQAGRYMAHYRGLRANLPFLDLCKTPAAAAEAALYARSWLDVDAAIVFSDILVVLEALGRRLEYTAGDGPRLDPLDPATVAGLRSPAAAVADLGYVAEAVRQTVAGLPPDVPCIGFAGAPFTLAAYAIEGGGSKQFQRTKTFMLREPAAWHRLCGTLAQSIAGLCNAQIAAGASAIQLFDSWAGCLNRDDYEQFVAPYLRQAIARIQPGVPVIVFGTGTSHLLGVFADCGADVVGVDSVTNIRIGWAAGGGPAHISVQGNLDPCALFGPAAHWRQAVDGILREAGGNPGHIFNLGHGIHKETDPDVARALVRYVHERSVK